MTNRISPHKHAWIYPLLLQLFLSLGLPCFASAGAVEVEIIKGEAIVGEELAFAIKFEVGNDNELIDVSQVRYNGAPIPHKINSRSSSSFTMVINGKTVQSSSDLVKNYIFSLPTDKVGTLEIPAFTVSVGDKKYNAKALNFKVTEKPTSDDLRFLVQIKNPQGYYYPSQVIDLECTILYRNLKGSPAIENISLPILKNLNFELLPHKNPDFELIINNQRLLIKQQQGTKVFQGKSYNSLTFHLKFRIMNHGDFNFENYLKMVVETGRTIRQPSLFFGYDVSRETKPFFANSTPLKITVNELPQKDVPPSFNGAIGNFKIKVTPSSDTAIRVGDPITLLIDISGRGTWEFVKSPPIDRDPKITDYFIVSNDPVVGEVNDDKTVKSFSVRLRVKSKTVKEIPAIPFTYFNLAARKYETVYSEPIPIKVFEANTSAEITDFGAPPPELKESKEPYGSNTQKETAATGLSGFGQGEKLEPLLPPLIQITNNVSADETTKNHAPVYTKLLAALLPILGVFIFYIFILFKGRNISEEKSAHLRAKQAYNKFAVGLDKYSKTDQELSSFYAELGQGIHNFLEERYKCTFPYLNRETLRPLNQEKKISEENLDKLLELIEKVDQHRYSSTKLEQEEALRLLAEAKEVIKKCD